MDTCRAPEKQNSHHFRECHTPFCVDTCDINHHDLVVALCVNWHYARIRQPGILPPVLTEAIESTKRLGWDKNSDVPDPLEELRCPLLYLACAFEKSGIVEGLLRHNFDPCVVNQHGETALHGAVRHLYNTGTSSRKEKIGKNVSTKKGREEAFFSIVSLLTKYYPRLLAFKANSGFTAFHLCATKITYTDSNRSATFHRFCLKVMIKRLFELEAASLLTKYEVMEIIKTADNKNGDSILHILARDRKDGFEVLKFIRLFVLLGIGTELPNEKNRRNETVFSIACQTNARDAAEIFQSLPSADSCQNYFDWRYRGKYHIHQQNIVCYVKNITCVSDARFNNNLSPSRVSSNNESDLVTWDRFPPLSRVRSTFGGGARARFPNSGWKPSLSVPPLVQKLPR